MTNTLGSTLAPVTFHQIFWPHFYSRSWSAAEQIQAKRKRVWEFYHQHLAEWAAQHGVQMPFVPEHCEQAYHMFYLLLPSLEDRQALIEHLKSQGILSVFHYVPLHLSGMGFKFAARKACCPVTEDVSARLLRLPFYSDLTETELSRVVAALTGFSAWGSSPHVMEDRYDRAIDLDGRNCVLLHIRSSRDRGSAGQRRLRSFTVPFAEGYDNTLDSDVVFLDPQIGMRIIKETAGPETARALDQAWSAPETFALLPTKTSLTAEWVEQALEAIPSELRSGHFCLFTSGSTGDPKMVVGERRRSEKLARVLHTVQDSEPVKETIGTLPLSYCFAFVNQWLWSRVSQRKIDSHSRIGTPRPAIGCAGSSPACDAVPRRGTGSYTDGTLCRSILSGHYSDSFRRWAISPRAIAGSRPGVSLGRDLQ